MLGVRCAVCAGYLIQPVHVFRPIRALGKRNVARTAQSRLAQEATAAAARCSAHGLALDGVAEIRRAAIRRFTIYHAQQAFLAE